MQNLFDQHYFVSGTLFDTSSFPVLNLTDRRTFLPGKTVRCLCRAAWLLPILQLLHACSFCATHFGWAASSCC